jgi:hypothetical protein
MKKVDYIEKLYISYISMFYVHIKRVRMTEFWTVHVYIHTEDLTQTINFSLSKVDKQRLIDMGY